MIKNPPANVGDKRDMGLIPGLGRPPGGGNGYTLQYSCLENPKDRGSWRATVHGITKESDAAGHTHTRVCMYTHINTYIIYIIIIYNILHICVCICVYI